MLLGSFLITQIISIRKVLGAIRNVSGKLGMKYKKGLSLKYAPKRRWDELVDIRNHVLQTQVWQFIKAQS